MSRPRPRARLLSARGRERLDRARNADNTMEGAFWAGVTGLGVGIVLLTAGLVVRARAEALRIARGVQIGE